MLLLLVKRPRFITRPPSSVTEQPLAQFEFFTDAINCHQINFVVTFNAPNPTILWLHSEQGWRLLLFWSSCGVHLHVTCCVKWLFPIFCNCICIFDLVLKLFSCYKVLSVDDYLQCFAIDCYFWYFRPCFEAICMLHATSDANLNTPSKVSDMPASHDIYT